MIWKSIIYIILGLIVKIVLNDEVLPRIFFPGFWHISKYVILGNLLQIGIALLIAAISLLLQVRAYRSYRKYEKYSPQKQMGKLMDCSSIFVFLPLIFECVSSEHGLIILLSIWFLGMLFDFLCKQILQKELKQVGRQLRAGGTVFVLQDERCRKPVRSFAEWINNVPAWVWEHLKLRKFPVMESRVSYLQNYIFLPESMAWIYREELKKCHIIYAISERKRAQIERGSGYQQYRYFTAQSERIMLLLDNNRKITNLPDEKYHLLAWTTDWLSDAVREWEENHVSTQVKLAFERVLGAYPGQEIGKRELCRMYYTAHRDDFLTDTEYFYLLLNMAEFMIHYKSLADYERNGSIYFRGSGAPSMGTLEASIVDDGTGELCCSQEYTQALKFLNQVITGREGCISKRNPAGEGRKRLVALRNRTTGHGSMAYNVNAQLTENLARVVTALAEQFLQEPDDMMQKADIEDRIPKCYLEEDDLYLLCAVYDSETFLYINYGTGKQIQKGKPFVFRLDGQGEL